MLWFLRNKKSIVPFFENSEPEQKLYFVKEAENCYDIKLGTPEYGFPELTYRDWLATYEDFELPKGKFINPRDLERRCCQTNEPKHQYWGVDPFL